MTIIDFETHFYPGGYLELLKRREATPRFSSDKEGQLVLEYNKVVVIPRQRLLQKFIDPAVRIKEMNSTGIDRQVVSIPLPGCDLLPPEEAVEVCRVANDGLSDLCEKHQERFAGLALLPVQDPNGSRDEFRRAVKELGLSGAHIHSNALGKMLDSGEYQGIFELASRMDVPVFVHPTVPYDTRGLSEYRLANTFGLQLDLSLSLLRFIFTGTLERLGGLKVVASHLGSTLPYISNRVDDEFDAARSADMKISGRPSEYIKRLYVDTVTRHAPPLEFALRYFGADNIIFGSDYPFWDTSEHVRTVRSSLSESDREMVFWRNAARLLKL